MPEPLVDRIVDNARARLPGALDTNIYFEMYSVLDEFFRISGSWREVIDVAVLDEVLEYPLEYTDVPSKVISLVGLLNENEISFAARLSNDNVMTLNRAYPAGAYSAWVTLSVAPIESPDQWPEFPQWASDRYGDIIADGIVARMMAQPMKPFTSPALAAFHARRFKGDANRVRIETNRQNLVGGQNWRFPRFAAQR